MRPGSEGSPRERARKAGDEHDQTAADGRGNVRRFATTACARSSPGSTANTGWRDEDGKFPFEFHKAMADGGWLWRHHARGIRRIGPRRDGGRDHDARGGEPRRRHGGRVVGHINLFGPHPIVIKGPTRRSADGCRASLRGRPGRLRLHRAGRRGSTRRASRPSPRRFPAAMSCAARRWTSTAQVANKIMLLTRTTK